MRILVTGVKGQLGFDCLKELASRGYHDVLGVDIEELDITDEKAVAAFVSSFRPDVIMHNAAWTAVDKAEQFPDKVYAVNALGPKFLAQESAKIGAKLVYISTDYVFPGTGEKPYEVDDKVGPTSIYGKTKLEGEEFVRTLNPNHFIVRISWVFGINGNNFIKTMLRLSETHDSLNIVDDQIGSPTYTADLARLLVDMIETEKYGIYHATNEGFCSWAEFAKEIFTKAHKRVTVHPVSTEEYMKLNPNQAKRPLNSRMSKRALIEAGFKPLPTWQDALARYLEELGK